MEDHQRITITVKELHPWGITVAVEGEAEAFLDYTKTPSWRISGKKPSIGETMPAVVLDASRSPIRVSALQADIGIAEELRRNERPR